MSAHLPARLDPHRAVAADEEYRGALPLSALPRLAEMIEPDQADMPGPDQPTGSGQAAYQMRFGRDASGRAVVQGGVQARLRLRCQRCNEPFDLPITAGFTLALVAGLDEAAALPDEYDPLLVPAAPGGGMIAPRDLIEDELILAIPVVPRHPDGDCPALAGGLPGPAADPGSGDPETGDPDAAHQAPARRSADREDARPNPFAILAQLKRGG